MQAASHVKIRPLAAGDKAVWLKLFKGYITFYKATVADDVIEATWQRLIASTDGFHIALVAVGNDDVPVGLAHVLFHPSTWTKTCYCYLEDLFVDPETRAKGVGRALVDAVYAEADKRGATRTYWTTQEFNYRARGLYDQMATKSVFVQYRR
ncbi:MAG: GNAT family N-acetyltransferase [Hyphomicrobiaceae bacterium]|nr:GNAT family N-acetyltransferase [Hyphomicrobiaceae bacterium]